jgi:replicative DNA helicase
VHLTGNIPDFGKVPPQAVDVEVALLGICLSYPDIAGGLRLTPDMFYKESHRRIYTTILEIENACDSISVTNRLRDKNELDSVGGPVYITQLTNNVYSDSMVENYAAIIKGKYLRREYIRISSELTGMSFDESFDLSELIEFAENSLFKVSDFTQKKEPGKLSKFIDEVLINVEKIFKKEKKLIGIPSGYTNVDRSTGGWQPSDLIIIAGRPSMGKTALVLELASRPAKLGYPVGIFSLEMSSYQLAVRKLSGASGYSNVEIRNAELNLDKLIESSHEIATLPIYIDDTPGISIMELRSKTKKLILKHGVKMIIVDYLQLMKGIGDNREQEVSSCSRGLKGIAKEFDIPVIAVSQLNRAVEKTRDKMPGLADLRESGAIEQDADIVGFVFRPAYYDMRTVEVNGNEISSDSLMLFYSGKNRNGALFMEPLYHNESITVIEDHKPELHNEPNF